MRHGGASHRVRTLLHQPADLTAQHDGLTALGVSPARIYVDHGLTGTTRDRPGLRAAMAACREGDTLVVTKLDRLARSLPDARAIADELTARQVRLRLGASVYDPYDPVGRLLFKRPLERAWPPSLANLRQPFLHPHGRHLVAERLRQVDRDGVVSEHIQS